MKRDEVKVNKNIKKEGGQYPAILTSCLVVNKGFVVWPEKELILAGPKWEISSGQGGP